MQVPGISALQICFSVLRIGLKQGVNAYLHAFFCDRCFQNICLSSKGAIDKLVGMDIKRL